MKKIINRINGWIILDKPYGMGSTTLVNRLKRYLHPSKIGHAGTLDPLATGVLPIALGEATKTIAYVMDGEKTYQFEVTWGQSTSTDDLEGEVVNSSEKRPTEAEINKIIQKFTGKIKQTPPIYSAIKIDGKRAYDIARSGENVALKSREVTIYDLKILNYTPEKTLFEVRCSKGTYVRSLGRDMGQELGCFGFISKLRRTKCGPFSLNHTILLENFEKEVYNATNLPMVPILTALDDILVLAVDEEKAKALMQGKALNSSSICVEANLLETQEVIGLKWNNQLIALAKYENGFLKPFRVLNNN